MRPRLGRPRAGLLAALAMMLVVFAPAGSSARAARRGARARSRAAVARRSAARIPAVAPEAFGAPFFDVRDGAVHWPLRGSIPLCEDDRRLLDQLRASRGPRDSIAAWLAAGERDSLIASFAGLEAARIALVARDSAAADTVLEHAMAHAGPWRWATRRQRARLALAHEGPAAADAILRRAPAMDMSMLDRLEWAEDRMDVLLRLGDSTQAIAHARNTLLTAVAAGPADSVRSAPWIAARIENRLETILRARGEMPAWSDDWAAARADLALGDRAAAIARLERVAGEAPLDQRWRPALERGHLLRAARRYDDAREALRVAEALAPDSSAQAQVRIERARDEVDARAWAEAGRLIDVLAAWPDSQVRSIALAQRARALESEGEWEQAADAYAASWRHGHGDLAAFRAGLLSLALGQEDSALAWFTRSRLEGTRFWQGVLLRRAHDPAGDSLLAEVARAPGYSFYAVAARESLGLRAWPGLEIAAPEMESSALRVADLLLALGRWTEARAVVPLWLGWSVRAQSPDEGGEPHPLARQVLHAAALAYSSKSAAYAIVLSDLAFGFTSDSSAALRWPYAAWSYPPAYDRAFAALPESLDQGIDRALMRAVARKESHFHAAARSSSAALGLVQLKLGTAVEAAHAARLRRPRERDLLDPARNVRLGSTYLARLLARFGSVPRALAAYNAGPGALSRWLTLWESAPGRALGGAALECELTCRDETIRYVKEILAARAAYRELRPVASP